MRARRSSLSRLTAQPRVRRDLSTNGLMRCVRQALAQVQQLCCPLFQATWRKVGSKRLLWERLRSHFWHFTFQSMHHLYEAILYDPGKQVPLPELDTS